MKRLFLVLIPLLIVSPQLQAEWVYEWIDSGGVGAYSSLAAGSDGQLHTSYMAMNGGNLKYAYYDGAQWLVELVDDSGLNGHYSTVQLDSAGNPHIAYVHYTGHFIRYASKIDGAWTFSDFETDDNVEIDVDMVLDENDLPHISYYDAIYSGDAHDLKYAHFNGTEWETRIVDSLGDAGQGSSIDVDSQGRPHISYYDVTNVTLKYAVFDGVHWIINTLDECLVHAYNIRTAIGVDSQDHLHLVYSVYRNDGVDWFGELKYGYFDWVNWTFTTIDVGAANRDFRVPEIAIDETDTPHASYMIYYNAEMITPDMKYATLDGDVWQVEFIDQCDMADSQNSNGLALASPSHIHVVYSDDGVYLKHAQKGYPSAVEDWDDADNRDPSLASGYALFAPSPNPYQDGTSIRFEIPEASTVSLELFDLNGRQVKTLARGEYGAGLHTIPVATALPGGVYLCRMRSGSFAGSQKLIVR